MSTLADLLRRCTAQVKAGTRTGSGFFVAPGRLVTCAHVVEPTYQRQEALEIVYRGRTLPADITTCLPAEDLALLAVPQRTHPCVYLAADHKVQDKLYVFGYPAASRGYGDYSDGDSLTVEYEGPSTTPPLLKLKGGQIVDGFSGAPALNTHTGTVCGMVTMTRDARMDLGGRAISAAIILSRFAMLAEEQRQFHAQDGQWQSLMPQPEPPTGSSSGVTQNVHNLGPVGKQININKIDAVGTLKM